MSSSIWIEWQQECDRCELLGLPKPPRPKTPEPSDDIEKNNDNGEEAEDNIPIPQTSSETTIAHDITLNSEQLNNVSGGLDQLNSILGVTQKKLNRFKVVCGSLTNLLKIRGKEEGTLSAGESSDSLKTTIRDDASSTSSLVVDHNKQEGGLNDLEEKISGQCDKLDFLIMKAERAESSMTAQKRQMKKYLAK